ncbi:uncharacterized protein LOC143025243 [Oratosquilla oratoria]|uniref:uncharacterized protein LOC143025243 n=1 Tax=Oratosquilla oratoria TaxID=337810 RepID=UPI003F758163
MAVSPVSLKEYTWEMKNQFVLPFVTQNPITQEAVVKGFLGFAVPLILYFDALKKDFWEDRSLGRDQVTVYTVIEDNLSDTFGIDGKACLMRFICELQDRPLAGLSVLGELLAVVFNPEEEENDLLEDYLEAKKLGNTSGVVCGNHFLECSISVFGYFESFKNVTVS